MSYTCVFYICVWCNNASGNMAEILTFSFDQRIPEVVGTICELSHYGRIRATASACSLIVETGGHQQVWRLQKICTNSFCCFFFFFFFFL